MALRILKCNIIARPVYTLQRLLSQAEPALATEKSPVNKNEVISDDEPDKGVYPPFIGENNPLNHNESHIGYYYRLPKIVSNKLSLVNDGFDNHSMSQEYIKLVKAFREYHIMVRKPALEIINNLKHADYEKPALRQVLYGQFGCGKTLTLAHIVHYGYKANYLLVHVPYVNRFVRHARLVKPSNFVEGAMDVPVDGSTWLTIFISQNSHLLSNPDLVTTDHYQWNDHESTEKGKPLLEMATYGSQRALYSNRVIDCLLREIKHYSTAGVCKTLVVIDGVNGFYENCVVDPKRIVHKGRVSLAQSFLEMTKFDWCNASVVVSVDQIRFPKDGAIRYKPYELLGKEGWEQLDPFVPIEVGNYTVLEAENAIEYYIQKKWLIHEASKTPDGRQELLSLSGCNPRQLLRICNPL